MKKSVGRLGRRHFIGGVAGAVGGALVVGCAKPDRKSRVQSFVMSPEQSLQGESVWFATASPYGHWGESVVVRTVDGRAKKVEGNPEFPVNRGKAHVRAQAGVQSLYHPDRLETPLVRRGGRGSGEFDSIGWVTALDMLVENFSAGKDLLLVTGRLAGTKARVASSFAQSLGGRHLIYEAMEATSLIESQRRAFGTGRTPHFDIGNAAYVLSFGADFLGTWVSPVQYSVAYGQFRHGEGRERGLLTQIEPRMSLTGSNADRWVYIHPGQEGAVALSIAYVIVKEGLVEESVWSNVLADVGGSDGLAPYSPEATAVSSGISSEVIRTIAREFAGHQPGIALVGGSALAQTNGSDIGAAVLLLNRIVGSLGRTGGVIANPPSPSDIPSPLPPTPYSEFASLSDLESIGSIFVYDVDPVFGLPKAAGFREVVSQAEFTVGMSTFMNETCAASDLVLPSTHPFEEWGDFAVDALDGRPVVGYQQPVVSPRAGARSFGDLLLTISAELVVNRPVRADTMHEAVKASAMDSFDDMDSVTSSEAKWTTLLRRGGYWPEQSQGEEFPSRIDWSVSSLREPIFSGDATEFPFRLIPFETVSLGMGPEAVNPWLQATGDPLTTVTWTTWVEMNPQTAQNLGLRRGDLVDILTPSGKIRAGVYDSPVVAPDVIGVPVGRGRQQGTRWDTGRGANVLSIVSAEVDGSTGALAWAATRAKVQKVGKNEELPTLEFFDNPRNDEEGQPVQLTNE